MSAVLEYWLLYHPFRRIGPRKAVIQDIETFKLSAHLQGGIIKSEAKEAPVLVYCSGREGLAADRMDLFTELKRDFEVVFFDYSGFHRPEKGTASVLTTRKSMQKDLETVLKLVQERFEGRPVVLYGEGIGGAVAIYALKLMLPEVEMIIFDKVFSEGRIHFRNAAFPFIGYARLLFALRGRAKRWDPLAQLDEIINEGKLLELPAALFIYPEKKQNLFDGLYHLWRGKKTLIRVFSMQALKEAFVSRHEKEQVNIYP